MSEEEIIKEAQYVLGCIQYEMQYDENPEENIRRQNARAIQGLLNLYNEQKELLQGKLFENYQYYKNIASSYQANCIRKDKIRDKKTKLEEIYQKEMKPYQTEFGLNLSLLSKKEKEEVINKRNTLLIEIEVLNELLEEE